LTVNNDLPWIGTISAREEDGFVLVRINGYEYIFNLNERIDGFLRHHGWVEVSDS